MERDKRNPVAKNINKFNRAQTHADRKKRAKRGYEKHKGKNLIMGQNSIDEKLSPSQGLSAYIKDFKSSKAPQFQDKSEEKKREMAIAAYLEAKNGGKKQTQKEACWQGYKQKGLKKKGDKVVPNCVPEQVEQIDELSKKTMRSYVVKALKADKKERDAGGMTNRRHDGIMRAHKKLVSKEENKINAKQLETLRKEYGKIDKVNPTGPAYKKMKAMIKSMSVDQLKGLAYAKIKWLSQFAASELRLTHNIKLKASEYMSEDTEVEQVNELDKSTLQSYRQKASADAGHERDYAAHNDRQAKSASGFLKNVRQRSAERARAKAKQREAGVSLATKKLGEGVEHLEEMAMPRSDFDKLKKGDEITITYDSSIRKGTTTTFVVKGKSRSAKYNVDKVSMLPKGKTAGMKYYLYSRGGKDATFAMGDMGAVMTNIVKESVDEASKVPAGMKFMIGHVYKGTSHTYYSKGNKMTSPVAVYINNKPWKEFGSLPKAKKAALAHIKAMKEEVEQIDEAMGDDDWVVVKGRKVVRTLKNPKNNKAPRNWQKSSDETEVIRVSKAKQMGIIKEVAESRNAGQAASGYQLYHKTFSDAMKHSYEVAKKRGYEVDDDDIFNKVATGPRKPSSGKTNSYILKTDKRNRHLHVQVANLDNRRYELNMYIESVELEESQKLSNKRAELRKQMFGNANYLTPAQRKELDAKAKEALKGEKASSAKAKAPEKSSKMASSDKNIILQLRKAMDYGEGMHPIRVSPTSTVKVPHSLAKKAVERYDALQKPDDKRKLKIQLIKMLRSKAK